ncbi:hypothetical protein PENARI_c049G11374, partial [Penicillium arizonense]
MESVEINGRDVIDPSLCRAVAQGHLDVVGLLVQQGARLNINESTIATHDTALCMAARGGDLEMVQALLRHDRIDFEEIAGSSKKRLHPEGHSKQNGRRQNSSNIVEAVSKEKVRGL